MEKTRRMKTLWLRVVVAQKTLQVWVKHKLGPLWAWGRIETFEALVGLVLLVVFIEFIGLGDGVVGIQLEWRGPFFDLVRSERLPTKVLSGNQTNSTL